MDVDIRQWLSERLAPIDEASFAPLPHRRCPESVKRALDVHHFQVPLASGIGASLLARPKDEGARRDVLVILFHGMGDDCTYPHWHWIESMVQRGLSVLSVDWDGHGVTGGSLLDMQSASRSFMLIIQKIYGEQGASDLGKVRPGPHLFLMGHSAGGALALLSVTRPEVTSLVKGVIAVSPAVVVASDSETKREALCYLRPSAWLKDLLGRVPHYGVMGLVPAVGKFRRKSFPIRLRVGIPYAEQLRTFVRETFEARRVLRDVAVPVLWLHGSRDRVVPYERAARIMSDIPSAMFCHLDDKRGHLRMVFSHEIPAYAARFIETCSALSY